MNDLFLNVIKTKGLVFDFGKHKDTTHARLVINEEEADQVRSFRHFYVFLLRWSGMGHRHQRDSKGNSDTLLSVDSQKHWAPTETAQKAS